MMCIILAGGVWLDGAWLSCCILCKLGIIRHWRHFLKELFAHQFPPYVNIRNLSSRTMKAGIHRTLL